MKDASHILSSVVSSLIRLTLASPPSPAPRAQELVAQLVTSLRSFHVDHAWDLAIPALRRASAVATRLATLSEHPGLVAALQGGTTTATTTTTTATAAIAGGEQFAWDWGDLDLEQLLNPA